MSTNSALVPTNSLTIKSLISSLDILIFLRGDECSVSLVRRNKKNFSHVPVAFATAAQRQAYVSLDDSEATLWVGSAAFDVSPKNGEHIVAKLGIRRLDIGKKSV